MMVPWMSGVTLGDKIASVELIRRLGIECDVCVEVEAWQTDMAWSSRRNRGWKLGVFL